MEEEMEHSHVMRIRLLTRPNDSRFDIHMSLTVTA